MRHLGKVAASFAGDESGSTAIEYGLIAALMAVAAIASMVFFGNSLAGLFNNVSNHVGNAATG